MISATSSKSTANLQKIKTPHRLGHLVTNISQSLRAWRHRWRLTQVQAAAALGVTVATLRNWEQVRSKPEGLALESLTHKLTQPPP